jgi:hypothetical protein
MCKDFEARNLPEDDQLIEEWFRRSAIARIRKERGQYHSMGAYWYALPQELPAPPAYEDYNYCNGRLARRLDKHRIQVKGLRSRSPDRVYVHEHREQIEVWLLSDRFLLGTKRSP